MCLYPISEIRIAEKNITCFKEVRLGDGLWKPIFMNSFGPYKLNTVLTAEKNDSPNLQKRTIEHLSIKVMSYINFYHTEECIITSGFHAMLNEETLLELRAFDIGICIIPRGAEYCLGNNNDIVSNKIIVFSSKFEYRKYLVKDFLRRLIYGNRKV